MRKLLNTIYITNELAYLSLEGEDLICKIEGADKIRLPLCFQIGSNKFYFTPRKIFGKSMW